MPRKRAHLAQVNHERWLISYADFVTLLFALFVVLFASSQTDKTKARQISESVTRALENGGAKAVVHRSPGGAIDTTGKGSAMMRESGGSRKIIAGQDEAAVAKVSLTELMPPMQHLTQALSEEIKDGKIEVHLESRGLVISLRQAAFFPSGGPRHSERNAVLRLTRD
jgi:chemotaxis protein MotB